VPWINAQGRKDIQEMDGIEWRGSTIAYKIGFVAGFLGGTTYIIDAFTYFPTYDEEKNTQLSKKIADLLAKKQSDKQAISINELFLWNHALTKNRSFLLKKYGIYEITTGQIVEGLDKLYEDFKNRRIKVQDAIYVIKKQIRGETEEEVEAVLQYLRADKDSEKLSYKNKTGEVVWIDFP
jgi:hypothetical protein